MSIKKRLNFIQYFFISFILMLCPFAASASTSASASASASAPILDSLWSQVDQLIEQALPKSALEKVDKIQIQSRKASDWSSYINCILHKGKIWKSYEEKPMLSMIRLLKNEILITPSPAKEVLYSILGQTLSEYYSMRRFYDHDQLPSREIDSQNIETWDFAYLLERIKENYKLSIAENDFALKTLLQKTPLEKYETLLQSEPDANRYRPSLYDLLSYRALDKFKELQNENSLSLNDEIQTIYNNLALFHSQDSLPLAWVDLMLNKNEYLHSQNKITDAEYVKQLEIWKNKYADFPICGDLLFALANYWYEQGSKYQCTDSSSFSYRFDKKKAYHYAKEAFDKYPQSIGAKNSNLLLAQIQNTFFSLQTARVAIPEMPILGSLQYQNMDSVFILFYKLNDTNLWDYQESMEKEQWVNTYSQAFPFQDRMYGLPQTNDYQNHRVELNLGILPIGSYLCRISSSADFSQATSSSQIIQVSPLSCLIVTENGETAKGFILDRISGKGIAGASIHLLNTEFNYQTHKNTFTKVGSYPSVSDGSFVIPAKEKAKTYRLFITYKKQTLWLDETIWLRQKQEGTPEGQKMVYWFTDRAIYRPGDIVEAKGILVQNLNDSISILSSQKITSSLYSPKNQELAKIENTSNAFGSFSLRFQIPLQGLKGRMYIQAFQSRIYFDVEDYKRPTFEVTFTNPSSSYILGDSIPVNGQALRYSGQELANAKYNYRIYRQKVQPFFRYIKSYYPSVSDKTLIQAGESTCNVSGQFALQFSSLLDSNLLLQNPRETLYQFLVEVDVRDINGEIQRGIHSFILSKTALFTYTNVEEHWVNTDSMPIAIQSMDVNGKSIPTKGHIRIYRIENAEKNWSYPRKWNEADQFIYSKTAFKALFPWDEYENSLQIENTQNRILVAEQNFTFGDSSVCFRDCQSWRQGKYQYELNVVDAKGNQAKQIGNFDFIRSLHKKEIYPSYFEFVNLTPQVKWGDKVSFLLSTQQNHLWVYYELRDSENHSNGHWVQLSNEQKIIEIPLLTSSKGSQNLSVFWVKNNHLFVSESNIDILRPNSNFKIQLNTFRNKIEAGNKETWEITIQNIDSTLQNKEIKEVLVSMYDASLDAFVPHHWRFSTPFIPKPYSIWNEVKYLPNFENIQIFLNTRYRSELNYYSFQNRVYSSLNWEGFRNFGSSIPLTMYSRAGALGNKASKAMALDNSTMATETENNTQNWERNIPLPIKTQIRNNFKETAFFYPSLLSDTNGNVRFSFWAPQGLSKWKFQCFAHSKQLQTALFSTEVQSEKALMIFPKLPRFVRSGDQLHITCHTQTLASSNDSSQILLQLFSLHSGEKLPWIQGDTLQRLSFDSNQNALNQWILNIPEGFEAIGYRFIATQGKNSDGEEGILPIYPREMKLTESLNLFIHSDEKKIVDTKAFFKNKSTTSYEYSLSLEFCQNPIWYAIKALPYLSSNINTSSGIATALFMQNLGRSILANNADIVSTIRAWQKQKTRNNPLDKNLDLKQIPIEQTPWTTENADNADLSPLLSLLDDNTFNSDQQNLYRQLEDRQLPNGAFSWLEGGNENLYITQEIVFSYSFLQNLQTGYEFPANFIFQKALAYLDVRYKFNYEKNLKYNKQGKEMYLSDDIVTYLYSKITMEQDLNLIKKNKIYQFFHTQAIQYWPKQSLYSQAILALYFYKTNELDHATAILKSIKERALFSPEMGLYFNVYNEPIYKAIETQALLIIAFETINQDKQTADLLKQWLIAQKRTQNWGSEKATSLAVYALCASENTHTFSLQNAGEINIQMDTIDINTSQIDEKNTEIGSGYFRKTWTGNEIPSPFNTLSIEKKAGKGISFGALYRQYSEESSKINASKGGLEIRKTYFVNNSTLDGKEKWEVIDPKKTLKIGDKVQVQLEIRSDRDLDFVHLVNMRAAALEPLASSSGYMYENGLAYYRSIEDASIHYFFEHIDKGHYFISYEVKVDQAGVFSDGVASIQCLYAPEFTGHSQGGQFDVR